MSEEKNDRLLPEEGNNQSGENQQDKQPEPRPEDFAELNRMDIDEAAKEKNADAIIDEIHEELASQSEEAAAETAEEVPAIDTKKFADYTLSQLAEELRELMDHYPVVKIKPAVNELKRQFDRKFKQARKEAYEQYVEANGTGSGFEFTSNEKEVFDNLYREYRRRLSDARKAYREQLLANKAKKEEIIAQLKALVTGQFNPETGKLYDQFKALKEEWKKVGSVPRQDYHHLWNTFKYWEEQFFDIIHLDREYRKKAYEENLAEKQKIINRAKELLEMDDVIKAFRELQFLHKKWKEDTGPVAKEYREKIWQEFKDITKQIHDKRRAYIARLKELRKQDWERKGQLVEKLKEIAQLNPETHQEWQKLIREVNEIHGQFFSGFRAPEELLNEFRTYLRQFNRNKNSFYKRFKEQQRENLQKKKALIEEVRQLKEQEDLEAAMERCKQIREEWKQIGFVPIKVSQSIWEEFKAACKEFYDEYYAKTKEEISKEYQNYMAKKEYLTELKKQYKEEDAELSLEIIDQLVEKWKSLGEVPEKVRFINSKFHRFINSLYRRLNIDEKELQLLRYRNQLQDWKDNNLTRKLENERRFIRDKIDSLAHQIQQAENNLAFFKTSDENNPLLVEMRKKIEKQKEALELWKAKQKILNEYL